MGVEVTQQGEEIVAVGRSSRETRTNIRPRLDRMRVLVFAAFLLSTCGILIPDHAVIAVEGHESGPDKAETFGAEGRVRFESSGSPGKEQEQVCREDEEFCSEPDLNEEPVGSRGMMDEFFIVLSKLGTSWDSVLGLLRRIVQFAGGTIEKDDVLVDNLEEGLVSLRQMVKEAAAVTEDSNKKWEFRTVPRKEFGKTIDDLLLAFLRWAAADGAPPNTERCHLKGGVNGRHEKINVSKAFRRLERYMTWMEAAADDLLEPPLTAASLEKAWEAFGLHLSWDECNRLVWWFDLGMVDMDVVRTLPPKDILRLFVWFSHYILFNTTAQLNGMVFANNLADVGMWSYMTMLPVDLGMTLQEFIISAIPLQTKLVLISSRPSWVELYWFLVKGFLPSGMRRRVVMIPRDQEQKTLDSALGSNRIPEGYCELPGNPEADIAGPFFLSVASQKK